MNRFLLLLFSSLITLSLYSQEAGDSINVKVWTFDSQNRDTVVSFPSNPGLTFEKIIMKYTMRCYDGLVSTGSQRNLGCREWDYSCNTYLVDSSKIEEVDATTPSHIITNFSGESFKYMTSPTYDYLRGTQKRVTITNTILETSATVNGGNLEDVMNHGFMSGRATKSQYLYTADELKAAGLTTGFINSIQLKTGAEASTAEFFKVKIKQTSLGQLDGQVDLEGFTEVYYDDADFEPSSEKRLIFNKPFEWDGESNLLFEFSNNNSLATSNLTLILDMFPTTLTEGLVASSYLNLFLANNAYVESSSYKGVSGNKNRTVEAWIRTNNGESPEICSWGANVANEKWVFRLEQGRLRVENAAGGTVGSTDVSDGQWHHVACVLDGNSLSDIKFYVDGVLDANSTVATTPINTNIGSNAINVRISRGVNNRYFEGNIADVRIWDTALDVETINVWKSKLVNSSHPNYSNLQLHYLLADNSEEVKDRSPQGIDGKVIGTPIYNSDIDGNSLVKYFIESHGMKPVITFYQGEYELSIEDITADRPILKQNPHFVIERTVVPGDPQKAIDDKIESLDPVQYWPPISAVFDEATGQWIEDITYTEDGTINITTLPYTRRFPFYNELLSFVTPYGIDVDFGLEGATWYFDMTDYQSILRDDKRLVMTLGGQWQEQMDVEFTFVVGTPPRDVVQYDQIWQGTNRIGAGRIGDIVDDNKFKLVDITLAETGESFIIKSSITGHGSEGEFAQNGGQVEHRLSIDGNPTYNWIVTQECSMNPIYPQGGTWPIDRQGWCPGERSLMKVHDITPIALNSNNFQIDYSTSNPANPSGDYRYHVAHQIVGYGPANFTLDARVTEIIAPNNTAEYTRVGTVCANPTIKIQNTGSTELKSLTIKYWLNGSQSPQVFEWTGSLAFMEEETVVIPSERALWYDLYKDGNMFHVEVSNPNGGEDEYSQNNMMSSGFDFPKVYPKNLTIEVRTNNAASQNFYELWDSNEDVVGSNGLDNPNTTYSDEYNLDEGCYKLVLTDLGGDGLQWWANPNQGGGAARLKDEVGRTLLTFEPDFGGGFEYSFSTDFAMSVEELRFLSSINVFPNPVQSLFTVQLEDKVNTEIKLIDLQGNVIQAPIQSETNDSVTFDIDALAPGAYLISIQNRDMITTRKIIKR
ncbi:MAG: hypothetical protein Kapaf2KO_06600 [Candidatus Kapaibacteriales bacterium]